eukprot:3939684-Rhodomonas_salina.5
MGQAWVDTAKWYRSVAPCLTVAIRIPTRGCTAASRKFHVRQKQCASTSANTLWEHSGRSPSQRQPASSDAERSPIGATLARQDARLSAHGRGVGPVASRMRTSMSTMITNAKVVRAFWLANTSCTSSMASKKRETLDWKSILGSANGTLDRTCVTSRAVPSVRGTSRIEMTQNTMRMIICTASQAMSTSSSCWIGTSHSRLSRRMA